MQRHIKTSVILLLCLTALACNGGKTSHHTYVYETCVNEIKTKLKAPSTAVFSSIDETKIEQKLNTYVNDGVTRGKWYISGYVDSQNSFGAQLRTNFSCKFSQWKNEITFDSATI